jgi:hypothetical protein
METPIVQAFVYNASENKMVAIVMDPITFQTERKTVDTAAFSKYLMLEGSFTARYFAEDLESYFNAVPNGQYACAVIGRFLETQKNRPAVTGSAKDMAMAERERYSTPDGWPFK